MNNSRPWSQISRREELMEDGSKTNLDLSMRAEQNIEIPLRSDGFVAQSVDIYSAEVDREKENRSYPMLLNVCPIFGADRI